MNKKTLCKLAEEKNIDELKKLTVKARYICPGCFRVSNDPERICCHPEEIDNTADIKELNPKVD